MKAPRPAVLAATRDVLAAVEHIAVGAKTDRAGVTHVWPTAATLSTAEEVSALRAFASLSDSRLSWHAEVHS